MSMLEIAMHWLAAPLLLAALGAGIAVAMARSLFAMSMALAACAAFTATALALAGAGDAGLALALVGAAWAPLLLLAAMLLSARAVKTRKARRPWFSIAAAAAMTLALVWVSAAPASIQAVIGAGARLGPWPALLMLVAGAACVGLLGYGERGALGGGET
jgi:hypothetical protein